MKRRTFAKFLPLAAFAPATHDRLERFGQIAGRMDHVATVEFLPASDCQEAPELLASAIGLKLTGDVPSDARAWTNSSTHCLA